MISIAGFGTLTGLVAFLPGYSTIGVWSLVLLLALRFIGGIFMGGEYTSNNTLAMEMSQTSSRLCRRTAAGRLPVGFGAVSLAASIMLALTTSRQYYDWGWRIPFLFGCALAFAFLIYYRTVPEIATVAAKRKRARRLSRRCFPASTFATLDRCFRW